MAKDLKEAYRTINVGEFPSQLTITLGSGGQAQSLVYEKVEWQIGDEKAGLRYGENPDQPAAMYRLVNGNLTLGGVSMISPGRWLCSDLELLQSGKHPGKINITDVDAALNILRYLDDRPAAVIIKHNNPCGAAVGSTLAESYSRAYFADRIAAFGGAVVCNRKIDAETARLIASSYVEVVAAPDFDGPAFEILSSKKNMRIMRIDRMSELRSFEASRFLDFKSLIDGGLIIQQSFLPEARSADKLLPAETEYKGQLYSCKREPTAAELDDMLFGWLVEAGVTSNSVLYVKDLCTVGIGTGEQDRVGVAEIARDKAYRKFADRLAWQRHGVPMADLEDEGKRSEILEETAAESGGLKGSVMISDAFFPFKDGALVGLREGVRAILQPGGSLRDFETIEACNEFGAAMKYTGQRSFRH